MWARWANVVLGAWLALSPLLLNAGTAPARYDPAAPAVADMRPASDAANTGIIWNNVIAGLIVIGCALAAMMPAYADVRWVNLVVGFWTLISPAVIPHIWPSMTTNNVIVGILVMLFSLVPMYQEYRGWSGRETPTYRPGRTPPTTPTTPSTTGI